MSGMTLVALLGLTLGAGDSDNYAQAHQATVDNGQPMLVMVSTEWCAPCQTMKKTVIPQLKQKGSLARVAFAIVNPDRDRDLAQKLTGGGPVPQLVLFRKTSQGWMRRKLIGGQSVEQVEQFINEGLAAKDDAAEPVKDAPKPASHDKAVASAAKQPS